MAGWCGGQGHVAEVAARDPAPLLTGAALTKRLKELDGKIARAERAAGGNLEETRVGWHSPNPKPSPNSVSKRAVWQADLHALVVVPGGVTNMLGG